jgi:hypothetical protein
MCYVVKWGKMEVYELVRKWCERIGVLNNA